MSVCVSMCVCVYVYVHFYSLHSLPLLTLLTLPLFPSLPLPLLLVSLVVHSGTSGPDPPSSCLCLPWEALSAQGWGWRKRKEGTERGQACVYLIGQEWGKEDMYPHILVIFKNSFLFFWPRPAACGILVPQPGIEPALPAVEAWSLNHWTTREVPIFF